MQTNLAANCTRFVFFAVCSAALSGCYGDNYFNGGDPTDENCLTPSNTIASKTLTTNAFSEFRIAEDWGKQAEITLEKGDRYEVTFEGPENVVEVMTATTSSKSLQISVAECFNGTAKMKISITTPTLTKLSNLAWNAKIRVKDFSGETLDISNSAYSDLDLDIDYKTLNINSSESGKFVITGRVENFEGVFGRISSLKGFGLEAQKADITSSTSNHLEVHVTEELNARITNSGNILYKGHPVIHESISGTGKVIDAN